MVAFHFVEVAVFQSAFKEMNGFREILFIVILEAGFEIRPDRSIIGIQQGDPDDANKANRAVDKPIPANQRT